MAMRNYKKISRHGSINIPVAMRRLIGIQGGDPMEVSTDGSTVTVRPYRPRCIFCGTNEGVDYMMHGKYVCRNCKEQEPYPVGGGQG